MNLFLLLIHQISNFSKLTVFQILKHSLIHETSYEKLRKNLGDGKEKKKKTDFNY